MNFRNPTWPQVVLLLGCIAGVIAAYKFLGEGAAAALGIVTHLLVLASSPKDPPAPPTAATLPAPEPRKDTPAPAPPASPWRALAFATLVCVAACSVFAPPDVPSLRVGQRKIDDCEAFALDAGDGGHLAALRACFVEAGLPQ